MQSDAFHEGLRDSSRGLNLHCWDNRHERNEDHELKDQIAAIENESCAADQLSLIIEELQLVHQFPILVDCPACSHREIYGGSLYTRMNSGNFGGAGSCKP